MYYYVMTMMILGWVVFVLNSFALWRQIEQKAETMKQTAIVTFVGLLYTLWPTYLIIVN